MNQHQVGWQTSPAIVEAQKKERGNRAALALVGGLGLVLAFAIGLTKKRRR